MEERRVSSTHPIKYNLKDLSKDENSKPLVRTKNRWLAPGEFEARPSITFFQNA